LKREGVERGRGKRGRREGGGMRERERERRGYTNAVEYDCETLYTPAFYGSEVRVFV
jgi:hypothetical protein